VRAREARAGLTSGPKREAFGREAFERDGRSCSNGFAPTASSREKRQVSALLGSNALSHRIITIQRPPPALLPRYCVNNALL
jgi:hypothetical protein